MQLGHSKCALCMHVCDLVSSCPYSGEALPSEIYTVTVSYSNWSLKAFSFSFALLKTNISGSRTELCPLAWSCKVMFIVPPSIYWLLPMCQVLQALCQGLDSIISLDPSNNEVQVLLSPFAARKLGEDEKVAPVPKQHHTHHWPEIGGVRVDD